MSLKGKVVIVTGGSSGIGATTAVELTKEGADVVIVARNQTKLEQVTACCEKKGKKPFVVNADLAKEEDVKRVMEETIKKYGKLDVLVNNAGFIILEPFGKDSTLKTYDSIMTLNLRAVVHLTYLAVPYLTKTKGNIVNISSVAALKNIDNGWAYCTSKAGLDHFSRCIAKELAPKGIRVNTVNPGPVKTDILEKIDKDGELMKANAEKTPLKRISSPEEIADIILFLASDRARGVTGSSWVSDNGTIIQ